MNTSNRKWLTVATIALGTDLVQTGRGPGTLVVQLDQNDGDDCRVIVDGGSLPNGEDEAKFDCLQGAMAYVADFLLTNGVELIEQG